MAYDEGLATRIHELVGDRLEVKKMFGGLCYMDRGHMAFGIVGDELMVRTGAEGYAAALAQPHAREMDFTGRALKGLIYVASEGFAEDEELRAWLERGLAYTRSQPDKDTAAPRRSAKKPAAKKTAAEKPTAKKTAAKKPTAKKTAAKKPTAKKPVAKKPTAKKPAAKKPAAKKPAAKKPASRGTLRRASGRR